MIRVPLAPVAAFTTAVLLFVVATSISRIGPPSGLHAGRRLQHAPVFADPKTVNSKPSPLTGHSFREQIQSLGTPDQVAKLLERHEQDTAVIQDLQYQVNMLKARSSHISGPMPLNNLALPDKALYSQFGMRLDRPNQFDDGTGGRSSKTQVPAIAVEKGLMQRTPDNEGWVKEWSSELINILESTVKMGGDISPPDYPGSALQVRQALEDHVLDKYRNPRILVAGSISPWVEATVLAIIGVPKVWVVDWQDIKIESSRIECLLMPDISKHRPRELFDIIITFSSIEHDGLGRYGDPMNPEGDLAAMAEFYSLLNPQGMVLAGVPVAAHNRGRIELNRHRMYSRERIDAIRHGYNQVDEIRPSTKQLADRFKVDPATIDVKEDDWQYQPIFVLKKNMSELPLVLARGT